MSFGGYKFKGYSVVKANLSSNTYSNWCLLVHQARIKAFIESCALSGAKWHFNKTSGDLSFETYGNVIYRVANANGDYNDYMSFFKYGTEELYYMIATLGEYYDSSGTPTLNNDSVYFCTSLSASNGAIPMGFGSALSFSDFDANGVFGSSYPSNALACSSCYTDTPVYTGNAFFGQNFTYLYGHSTSKIGYCTKGKSIITFIDNSSVSVESVGGFTQIFSPDDNYNIFKVVLNGYSNETGTVYQSNRFINNGYCQSLNASGARMNVALGSTHRECRAYLNQPVMSCFKSAPSKIPYEPCRISYSMYIYKTLNSNGIVSKGMINNELMCMNGANSNTILPAFGTTVLGGKMITARQCNNYYSSGQLGYFIAGVPMGSNANLAPLVPCLYVGWDTSNPDITQISAYPELALQ